MAASCTLPLAMSRDQSVHSPVLPEEVVALLGSSCDANDLEGLIVDATLGAGGHTALLLERFPRIRVLGTDQDPEILEIARKKLEPFGERVRLERLRITELSQFLREDRCERPVGMLMDVGVSSLQLDRPSRGFSFSADGPLDMRMDPNREQSAADIVNGWSETKLADLFYNEGGERRSRPIAAEIVRQRRRVPFLRTSALAEAVAGVVGSGGKIHPATRVFQALRRAVNEEGVELEAGLSVAQEWLAHGGVLAVISFHSGEDGVVKRFLKQGAKAQLWNLLTAGPVRPGREEVRSNARSRSALLRGAQRLRADGDQELGGSVVDSGTAGGGS